MYWKMEWKTVSSIVANPDYYSDDDKKCAIYNLNNAIDNHKIIIKQYKDMIELIKRGSK